MIKKILLLLFFATHALALNSFFSAERDGYFYYKDPITKKSKAKRNKKKQNAQTVISQKNYESTKTKMEIPFETKEERSERKKQEADYMANIPWQDLDKLSADEYRRLLDTTREIAVATPKKEYVKAYAALQKFWVDKSEKFAKVWKIATLENPEELIYPDVEFGAGARKIRYRESQNKEKQFFSKLKSRLGLIVIIEDKNDKANYNRFKIMYDYIHKETGLEYIIYDYYDVPTLVRKLKIKRNMLPENYLLYRGNKNKIIYKRVANGYSSAQKIIENTKFVFKNGILEDNKNPQDRLRAHD